MLRKPTSTSRLAAIFCLIGLLLAPGALQATEIQSGSPSSCLWKVQSGQNTIYLLGSIHLLKKENYPLHQNIYRAFDQASNVVFEVDLHEMSSPQVQLEAVAKGMYTNGKSLKDALSPESYERVKTHLKNHGMGIGLFSLMKPWMMATTITTLELQKLGFQIDQGVDTHLFQKAQAAGKTIVGLETVSYQLSLFDGLSPKTQELFLLQTLEELSILEKETQQIVESWSQGRTDGLEVMLKSMRQFPEVHKALITTRNNNWMPQIESYLLEEDTSLIVVGTMHLLGDEGLLSMLQDKGYRISQL